MKTLKHSKFRNTGLLFELMSRQLTSDILTESVKDSPAGKLIKKYFHKNSELSKELEIYQTISKTKLMTENKLNSLLDILLKTKSKLSNTTLRREKYNLVKELQEHYNLTDFFNMRVPDYKIYASAYRLFEYSETDNPNQYINNKYFLIESKLNKPINKIEKPLVEIENKEIGLLAYKFLVEKFNQKYKGLSVKQKQLLEQYITNVSNTTTLKEYVNKEIKLLKSTLNTYSKQTDNKVLSIKIHEVRNLLDKLTESKKITDDNILNMLNYYELVKEIKKVL